jgi:magnesium chelatase subunit D
MVGDSTFPFSAIVAQAGMKQALILAAIHPSLGGVLIRGTKGAAKSTAVRALAALLPAIEVFEGDPFRRAPTETIAAWPLPEGAQLVRRPVALVNLPVGATDDRVVGSLNFERALSTGQRHFEPGLLAAAHRGILYIDEVNLLGDHLVDLLLDAAAMGVNHVEREGVAFQHPARFVLVGTMNPEEGDLRPQLLDRFGLAVEAEPMHDPVERAEVVRRRLAFESNAAAFRARWAEADRLEGERIVSARRLLPDVVVPEAILDQICTLCAREGADGLRADLTIHKAATALAAYEGRTEVTHQDVQAVAELALAHRRTGPPRGPTQPPPPARDDDREPSEPSKLPHKMRYLASGERPSNGGGVCSSQPEASDDDSDAIQILPADEPVSSARWAPRASVSRRGARSGRRGKPHGIDRTGVCVGARRPSGPARDLAIAATLRAAAPWQQSRERYHDRILVLRPTDLNVKVRVRPRQHLILFVVDASRSMGAQERMKQTKGAVLSLLVDAYQKRDRVGLITFGKGGAKLVLSPTRSVQVAARHLRDLPIGGATPLAAGLDMAIRVLVAARRREPGVSPLVVLLTDGRGNLPVSPAGNPETEALARARQLACDGVSGLVIDTEIGAIRLGMARALAAAWGVESKRLEDLHGARLPDAVRRALFARIA